MLTVKKLTHPQVLEVIVKRLTVLKNTCLRVLEKFKNLRVPNLSSNSKMLTIKTAFYYDL